MSNWSRELFADLVATISTGPAYFFASVNFFLGTKQRQHNKRPARNHHPDLLRLRVIYEALLELGWQESMFEGYHEIISVPIDEWSGLRSESKDAFPDLDELQEEVKYSISYKFMEYAWKDALDAIRTCVPSEYQVGEYSPEVHKKLREAAEALQNLHVIAEVGAEALSLPVVFASGWFLYEEIYRTKKLTREQDIAVRENLNRLVIKSMESLSTGYADQDGGLES